MHRNVLAKMDRLYLNNWRPITLLNADYNLIAKALVKRIIMYLPKLVNDDQTGYVKDRYIGTNIRLIEDMMHQTTKMKIPGIILTIDFEKAFDSLRWDFMYEWLKLYNFGTNFIYFIKTLCNETTTAVINNGNISNRFKLERRVRQGCPISTFLFILAVEILSSMIRSLSDIKGIKIGGTEIKISQLADDAICFMKDDVSLRSMHTVFDKFKNVLALKWTLIKL